MKRQRINSHARERYAKRNQERIGVGRGRKPKRSMNGVYTLESLYRDLAPMRQGEIDTPAIEPAQTAASEKTELLYTSYANKNRGQIQSKSERAIMDEAHRKTFPRARRFVRSIDALYSLNVKEDNAFCDNYLYLLLLHCDQLYAYFVRQSHEDYWKRTYDHKRYPIEAFALGQWRNAIIQHETYLSTHKRDLHRKAWSGVEAHANELAKSIFRAKKETDDEDWITGIKITDKQCMRAENAIALCGYNEESVAFYHALLQYLRRVQGLS